MNHYIFDPTKKEFFKEFNQALTTEVEKAHVFSEKEISKFSLVQKINSQDNTEGTFMFPADLENIVIEEAVVFHTLSRSFFKEIGEGATHNFSEAYRYSNAEVKEILIKEGGAGIVIMPLKYEVLEKGYTLPIEDKGKFSDILGSLESLLNYKNANYGNSALEPLNIFSEFGSIGQRIDDKLARVKNSEELRKNDVADLLGYLVLLCKEHGFENFDEFKD